MLTILRSCFPVLSGSCGSTVPEKSGNEAQPRMATHVTCLCTLMLRLAVLTRGDTKQIPTKGMEFIPSTTITYN